MRVRSVLLVVVLVLVVAVAGAFAYAWRSAIPEQAPQASFDSRLVKRGAQLAAVGNCISCHTVPGQQVFAGGLPLATPFGIVYSTNISPDQDTGIGRWSEAAFQRAMHKGVDREGNHLYPAFPYDHFTHVTSEDNQALYAYLMTRRPVRHEVQSNQLRFPYNIRMLVAGWKLLFFKAGPYANDQQQDAVWNRGAYLAEGLGHCGACHTPRQNLGAEDNSRHFAGGEAEGWQAYAINESSPAPVPWTVEAMSFYLRHGYHEIHGISRGPMAEVTGNLGFLPDEDIEAIATYVVSRMGTHSAERIKRAEELQADAGGQVRSVPAADSQIVKASAAASQPGEAIYNSACASCHESGRPPPFGGLHFQLSTAVNAPNPQNIVNVTLFGLPPADGEASSIMPAYHAILNDQQVADLLAYMRQRFSKSPPWQNLVEQVRQTRSGEYRVTIRPADGIERGPANIGAKK
jgi:mono/diheme cytochrome c family protein